jgi:choline dehydrogenase-like flavoprotein
MIYDSPQRLGSGRIDADICIVGSGAAGLSLASAFFDSAAKVVVLESGAAKPAAWADELDLAETIGVEHRGITAGRVRAFGGTTRAWGGQLIPLRQSELASRPWVPHSGWPIAASTLEPYYRAAESVLGVNGPPYDATVWNALGTPPPDFDPAQFCFRFSQWAPLGRRNFGLLFGPALRKSRNVHVVLDATATAITTAQSGAHAIGVRAVSQSGHAIVVGAHWYVLACGAIETARLLLASDGVNGHGVANSSGLVGRFFQDHISCIAGEIRPSSRAAIQHLFNPRYRGRTMYSCKVELSDRAQQDLGLLNVMGHVKFAIPEALGLLEVKRMVQRIQTGKFPVPSLGEALALARGASELARLMATRMLRNQRGAPSRGAIYLLVDAEQTPDANSRVCLGDERDARGMRRAVVDWRVGEAELRTIQTFAQLFARAFERAGLGQIDLAGHADFELEDSLSAVRDIYHQMGTTRMSTSPQEGVVDPNLCSHDIDNLCIVGGSVFPAGGIANPTFTIIALALRLADELKKRLASGEKSGSSALVASSKALEPHSVRINREGVC